MTPPSPDAPADVNTAANTAGNAAPDAGTSNPPDLAGFPRLLLVCGLPGSGKSTFAEALAAALDARWLNSDRLRVELGLRGDYSAAAIDGVYGEMLQRAGAALQAGERVVLDATFASRRYRDAARELATAHGLDLALVRTVADEATTLARVGRIRAFTEAGAEVYRLLQERFDPIDGPCLTLDSGALPLPAMVRTALEALAPAPATPA